MMRFFEQYFHADPLTEIDEATAHASGYYAEELAEPRRLHRYIAGKLDAVLYPDWLDPSEPIADLRRRGLGVKALVYSPVEYGNVSKRFRTWDVRADGQVERISDIELDENGRILRESYANGDGVLEGYMVYRYNEWGETAEVVTHAADGRVINREG